jgi:hypothetical protein
MDMVGSVDSDSLKHKIAHFCFQHEFITVTAFMFLDINLQCKVFHVHHVVVFWEGDRRIECYRLELFHDACRTCPWMTELCMRHYSVSTFMCRNAFGHVLIGVGLLSCQLMFMHVSRLVSS